MIIGSNYLTNLQLFWVAKAVHKFVKYHRTVPKNFGAIPRLQDEYLHYYFKLMQGFQEAFKCNITAEEIKIYNEFVKKFIEISSG